MYNFKGKRVLVAGGTGLIGTPLVELLLKEGAHVRTVSLDDPARAHPYTEFFQRDVLAPENCLEVCKGMNYVFNLLCIKGSPAAVRKYPNRFFKYNFFPGAHLLDAAYRCGAEGFLLTSTFGVYHPAEVFYEDAVWTTTPSEHDWEAGWAKRMGELYLDTYRREYGWDNLCIVRPASTYGPYDNFGSESAMVVPSLIHRAVQGENPFYVWGDGSEIRDFIHAKDVARGMLMVAKSGYSEPVNLGSGIGVSIKDLVEEVVSNMEDKPKVVWDISKASGDKKRVLDVARARSLGFEPTVSLVQGIKETMLWYKKHRGFEKTRFDVLSSPI